MSEIDFGKVFFLSVLMILLSLSLAATGRAAGLSYSGSFEGREDANGEIIQADSHAVGLTLAQRITNFISVAEQIRYSSNWRESSAKSERLRQSIDLVDVNRLFRFNLSGSARSSFEDGQEQQESETIETGFKGKWQSDSFPVLSVIVGRDVSRQKNLAAAPEIEVLRVDTTVYWSRSAVKLYYNYLFSEMDAGQGSFSQTSGDHSGRLTFADSYWHEKLRVRFNQNYSLDRREQNAASSIFAFPLLVTEVRTGPDTTPLDNSLDPLVVINNSMRDGDLATPAYNVTANSTFNNILLVLNGQTVNQIYLYTQTGFATPPAGLNWSLYSNDILSTSWNDASASISGVTYNVAEQRFEIEISPLAANYIMLGLDYLSLVGPIVDFTEVQVFDSAVVGGAGSTFETISSSTSLFLSGVLSRNFKIDYLAEYKVNESKGNSSFKTDELFQRALLAYNSLDRKTSANFTVSRRNQLELESTIYSFDLGEHFLPTLFVGVGWSKTEDLLSSLLISGTSQYHLSCTAQLYPDLEMTVGLGTNETWFLQDNIKQESRSNSLALDITARLGPPVTLHLYEKISERKIPVAGRTFRSGASLSWHISKALFFNMNGDYTTDSADPADSFNLSSALNFALTRQALLLLNYNYAERKAGEIAQGGGVSLRWTPKRGLRFESGVNYSKIAGQSDNEFMVYGRLAVNFRVP